MQLTELYDTCVRHCPMGTAGCEDAHGPTNNASTLRMHEKIYLKCEFMKQPAGALVCFSFCHAFNKGLSAAGLVLATLTQYDLPLTGGQPE